MVGVDLPQKASGFLVKKELEYFAIPARDPAHGAATNEAGLANPALQAIKRDCAQILLEKQNIFTALQRNVNKENNVAEQHLIDMLCMRCVARAMQCARVSPSSFC